MINTKILLRCLSRFFFVFLCFCIVVLVVSFHHSDSDFCFDFFQLKWIFHTMKFIIISFELSSYFF